MSLSAVRVKGKKGPRTVAQERVIILYPDPNVHPQQSCLYVAGACFPSCDSTLQVRLIYYFADSFPVASHGTRDCLFPYRLVVTVETGFLLTYTQGL